MIQQPKRELHVIFTNNVIYHQVSSLNTELRMIKKIIPFANLSCSCFDAGSERVVYLLMPEAVDPDQAEALALQQAVNLVVVSGMNWNRDLTPWRAPGIRRQDPDFGDGAEALLVRLEKEILPAVEKELQVPARQRILAGVSLSGLFALWAWCRAERFDGICSLSGSFWYAGFADWFCKQPVLHRDSRIYLALGEKEAKATAGVFGRVDACTRQIADYLQHEKIQVWFEYSAGNHFAPVLPRLQRALAVLM